MPQALPFLTKFAEKLRHMCVYCVLSRVPPSQSSCHLSMHACLLLNQLFLQLSGMRCRGKDQPSYSPSMDMGGYVIIINSEKVTVTGDKVNQKLYRNHRTTRPGTLKTETFKQLNQVLHCHHAPDLAANDSAVALQD